MKNTLPPSSDNPYKKKPKRKAVQKRAGAKKGHKGHIQKRMMPTEIVILKPERCPCGKKISQVELRENILRKHIQI
ncbi:hypothetical protein B2D07_18885 [Desulfococcus multivorans]|nr:uncharacterized protein Dmul_37760 [Desulfococcus multivorans]AQV02637.1 hypothetical protein B2D07_18885 [Desulfococcus multivorans]